MIKIRKGNKITIATKKAYDLLYKSRGFEIISEQNPPSDPIKQDDPIILNELSVGALKELAKKYEIKGYYRMVKDELISELEKCM